MTFHLQLRLIPKESERRDSVGSTQWVQPPPALLGYRTAALFYYIYNPVYLVLEGLLVFGNIWLQQFR